MQDERGYWQVCVEHDDRWECLGSHETRAEAEMNLRSMSPRCPEAFVVRITMTRMMHERARPTLRVVYGRRGT